MKRLRAATPRLLIQAMLAAGLVVAWTLTLLSFERREMPSLALTVVSLSLMSLTTVALHEWGHLLGARVGGMTVVSAHIGPIQLLRERRGWRFRWKRPLAGISGYLQAFPDPTRSFRRQQLAMVAGGPAANLGIAALAAVAAAIAWPTPPGSLWAAFAAVNLAFGLANLVPLKSPMWSDGAVLSYWMRTKAEDPAVVLYAHTMGRVLRGRAADQFTADELQALASAPLPAPLLGAWIGMKAAQSRGEWRVAAASRPLFDQAIAPIPEGDRHTLKEFLELADAEIAFSGAMHQGSTRALASAPMTKGARWLAPHLHFRIEGLCARLNGEFDRADAALARSRECAENSVDLGLIESETKLRAAILALTPT